MNLLESYGANERFFKDAAMYPSLHLARVISQYKDLCKIVTQQGECLAEISGKFRYESQSASDYPAVGDFVMVDRACGNLGNAVIHRVLRRFSAFERAAVGADNQMQVVAANIDVVFICMSLNKDYNPSRLERYLSVAWNSGATPVVVLTKSDLCSDLPAALGQIGQIAPGAHVIATSGLDGSSLQALMPYLKPGRTASFVGSSGVGKSTLINLLLGKERLQTSHIRADDDKGRHTTTRRDLLLLPGGGIVIDTPGMRELGAESTDLSKSFSDIDELATLCRFSDCSHAGEPGCAVQNALDSGELDERRLESYKKLKRESKYDGLSSKQIEEEKINSMFGGKNNMKRMMQSVKQKNHRR